LKFRKHKREKPKEGMNYIEMKKKKRIQKFLMREGIHKEEMIMERSRSKTVEDFGKQSNLAIKNLHENLNEQNKSIFDRLRQRKDR
jgi:hypothetical protein